MAVQEIVDSKKTDQTECGGVTATVRWKVNVDKTGERKNCHWFS